MKINNYRKWSPWMVSGLLVLGAAVRAEPSGKGPGMGKGEGPFERIKTELGLTDEQAQKLKEHRESHRKEMEALREEVKAKHEALKTEMEKPNFDEGKVRSLQKAVQEVHAKLADHRLDGILAVKKILTPEQFAKFQASMKERRGQWGPGGGERRRGGMGGGEGKGPRGGGNRGPSEGQGGGDRPQDEGPGDEY